MLLVKSEELRNLQAPALQRLEHSGLVGDVEMLEETAARHLFALRAGQHADAALRPLDR